MSRINRKVLFVSAALTLVLGAGACGLDKATEPFRDARRSGVNDAPAEVITFPDGFSNVASKCDGPNRVYVIFKADNPAGSVAVAPNDPRCGR